MEIISTHLLGAFIPRSQLRCSTPGAWNGLVEGDKRQMIESNRSRPGPLSDVERISLTVELKECARRVSGRSAARDMLATEVV